MNLHCLRGTCGDLLRGCDAGDRVTVLLSSGNPGGTQALISFLRRNAGRADCASLGNAASMFDAALLVAAAMREVASRNGEQCAENDGDLNVSFIAGGQSRAEMPRLFRIYADGNSIETDAQTPCFQTDEKTYGKPVDLICYKLVSLQVGMHRRFDSGNVCFMTLGKNWRAGTREVFGRFPELD